MYLLSSKNAVAFACLQNVPMKVKSWWMVVCCCSKLPLERVEALSMYSGRNQSLRCIVCKGAHFKDNPLFSSKSLCQNCLSHEYHEMVGSAVASPKHLGSS